MEDLNDHTAATCKWRMRLFVAGNEPNSVTARKNLKQICETELNNQYDLQVIDVFNDFKEAIAENILVTPVLIIDNHNKIKIYGNLQDRDKVLSALGLI